jgi:hypothetical protein
MIKKILKHKSSIRCIIFSIIVCTAYILSIMYLYWYHDILWSITCIMVLFIFFHFLFIDIKWLNIRHGITTILSLIFFTIWVCLFLWWDINIWIIFSIIFYNISIVALFFSLWYTNFNSISYFTAWWFIFTVFVTITYSFALIGMFQKFPFTCQWLNDASNKLYQVVEAPFTIFKKDKNVDNEYISEQKVAEMVNNFQEIELVWWSENKITNKFNQFKSNIVEEIMNDTSEYSDGVCDLLLSKINHKFEDNSIKWSLILLSYLLLYWFIRIAFFIMTGIAFIIFKILYWCKVYKISGTTKKVDEIY